MVTLSDNALRQVDPAVAVPTYSRAGLPASIVHIGVGGFHRAHQAVYLDDLLQRGVRDWSISGVGLLPQDRRMADALLPQDCLYTVVERSGGRDNARVIGSLTQYQLAPEDPLAVLQSLASSETRLVTLTITEGGYNFDQATGAFNAQHPDVVHDLAHPHDPVSVFGYLAEALDRRRRGGLPPFTVLSCDNLPHNGDVIGRAIRSFSELRDPVLAAWIAHHVAFPNCMVDRITPQTTADDRALVQREFGIDDAWPVVCEPFRQWIIEDTFSKGRPPLADIGVQFTADVGPYELMKLRLLNGSHSAMGYLGALAGYEFIADVMADPLFRTFIARLMDDEMTPLLPPVPGIDLADYKHTLVGRFANPAIRDQVARICLDGSAKMPKFLLPALREQLAAGGPIRLLTLAVAGWFRYLRGINDTGKPITVEDPMAVALQERARQGGNDPRPLLGLRSVFGDLADSTRFVNELASMLTHLDGGGAHQTLTGVLTND